MPTFVKAETTVRETLGAGLAATRLEAAVDGNVLVPHVQVPECVGLSQEGAEDNRAPRVRRPYNGVALMIVKRGFFIDVATIGIRDRAKYACVIVELRRVSGVQPRAERCDDAATSHGYASP
jgi:hypothetical protein